MWRTSITLFHIGGMQANACHQRIEKENFTVEPCITRLSYLQQKFPALDFFSCGAIHVDTKRTYLT